MLVYLYQCSVYVFLTLLVVQLLQGVVMSTFIVAISRPQLLGTVMPTDMMGISTTTQSADSVHSHTNNPLLYYVMTTDRGT